MTDARAAAERAARESFGRLVALLAASTGDLALAEDALSAAFEQALTTWPRSGVPHNPQGWLLTVARNRQRDVWKSAAYRGTMSLPGPDDGTPVPARVGRLLATDPFTALDPDAIPDKRLELLFACAGPEVDPGVRTPLMLQVVLGFEAARIAEAFAVPAVTMAQRLVRAKKRIRDAAVPLVLPDRAAMPDRLTAVLEAVYGCYTIDWGGTGAGPAEETLAAEARYLAITLAALLDREPEAWGLAALITLSMARAGGRPSGRYVPLDAQDTARWDRALIAEGEGYLRRASTAPRPGRFQMEAAIQAVHCARARTGRTDWAALRTLYAALLTLAPTLGAHVAFAATVGRTDGPDAGLAVLAGLPAAADTFQPAWATRAYLLERAGRRREAGAAYRRAAELTRDATVAAYLTGRARAAT